MTDREQFIRDNAVSLIQERDQKIARQRVEIARLTRAVTSLKRELQGTQRSLRQRWRDDPSCHWCLMVTHLSKERTPKGGCPDFWATLDHLVSKKNGNGQKGDETVLACYFCNFQRNNAEQKGRAVKAERNGLRLTFLPDGTVRREKEDELGITEGTATHTATFEGSRQAAQAE